MLLLFANSKSTASILFKYNTLFFLIPGHWDNVAEWWTLLLLCLFLIVIFHLIPFPFSSYSSPSPAPFLYHTIPEYQWPLPFDLSWVLQISPHIKNELIWTTGVWPVLFHSHYSVHTHVYNGTTIHISGWIPISYFQHCRILSKPSKTSLVGIFNTLLIITLEIPLILICMLLTDSKHLLTQWRWTVYGH